jgi:hypothetical protein
MRNFWFNKLQNALGVRVIEDPLDPTRPRFPTTNPSGDEGSKTFKWRNPKWYQWVLKYEMPIFWIVLAAAILLLFLAGKIG